MSTIKEIVITIDKKTGEMRTETMGFKGESCEEVLNKISKEMKSKIIEKKNKPERFQQDTEKEKQRY